MVKYMDRKHHRESLIFVLFFYFDWDRTIYSCKILHSGPHKWSEQTYDNRSETKLSPPRPGWLANNSLGKLILRKLPERATPSLDNSFLDRIADIKSLTQSGAFVCHLTRGADWVITLNDSLTVGQCMSLGLFTYNHRVHARYKTE